MAQSLVLQFNKVIDQEKGVLQIGVKESGAITDLITLKVYEFPMINILWLGVIVMVVGFVMSIIQRYKTLKNKTVSEDDYFFVLKNGKKLYPKLVYRIINIYC